MKASEFIEVLSAFIEEHGDLPFMIGDEGGCSKPELKVVEVWESDFKPVDPTFKAIVP